MRSKAFKIQKPATRLAMWLNNIEFDVIWTAFQLLLKLHSYISVFWPFCRISVCFFFLSGFLLRTQFTGHHGKGGDHLLIHSATSTRSHIQTYLQICMWDDYHVFLIAPLVFTRALLDEIYHLIELAFEWLMMLC